MASLDHHQDCWGVCIELAQVLYTDGITNVTISMVNSDEMFARGFQFAVEMYSTREG